MKNLPKKLLIGFFLVLALVIFGCITDGTGGALQPARINADIRPEPTGIVCTDTDGGNNIRLQGTARETQDEDIVLSTRTDNCISGTVLQEFFCQGTSIQSQQANCPNGMTCANGACNPPQTVCGNGIIENNEQCDGTNFGGQTCQTLGFPGGGTLTCSIGPNGCQFNTTGCIYTLCGNGVCDVDENATTCPQDCVEEVQLIELKQNRGYPFDPNQTSDFPWMVEFYFNDSNSGCDSNGTDTLCGFTIFNDNRRWRDGSGNHTSPPLYVPSQALTPTGQAGEDTANFLDSIDTSYPGYSFFKYQNLGFETDEQLTDIIIGVEPHTLAFTDSNNRQHNIPFYIQLPKDNVAGGSFIFDGRTIYYASDASDYLQWDGNATFSRAPISSSSSSDFLVTASDGRRTMYWMDGSVQSDPTFVDIPGLDDKLFRYRIYGDNSTAGDLYLIFYAGSISFSGYNYDGLFDADIKFLGTDTNEDGGLDVPYYWINHSDFGGGAVGQQYIAHFQIETGGSYTQGAEPIPDFDTKVFVDTRTGKVPTLPNLLLSYYSYSARYSENSVGGIVSFNMDNDPNTITQPEKAYNDYGAFFELLPDINQNIPAYIELPKDNVAGGSFIFDERTLYYASDTTDYGTWDGNSTFSRASIPTSTASDFLVTASDGRHTMYWMDGSSETDPVFVYLPGQDDRLYRYKVFTDAQPTGSLYLVLDEGGSSFTAVIPDNARHGVFEVAKVTGIQTETKTFISGESAGTNNFSSLADRKEYNNFFINDAVFPSLINESVVIRVDGTSYARTFKERLEGSFDQLFDYTTSGPVADIEGLIQTREMKYKVQLGAGIPRNFVDGSDDNIVIPFFGGHWRVVSAGLDQGTYTVVLEAT